ncbi:MAG: ABC transporter ATP-binding protein [Moritella sp.]|uniref:ABC transporter ATP-binding protein n=1 Tax=Moritella sp. TaxID=78556 RepID=UPI0029B62D3A|nr:ABC transporter ATP-binding protein [Moritella sp.]MDX2322449.1 ABC transporter ATP-binding protein [Moritella sp.]
MMKNSVILTLAEVNYQQRLHNINISITQGGCLFLLGPNGSGKSTLLAILAGHVQASQGEYLLADRAVTDYQIAELALQRAWLPQASPPPFAIPVYQFIALGLHPLGISLENEQACQVINQLLARLDIAKFVTRNCDQLSGGEWQRVLIARTLVQVSPLLNPQSVLCLLDEPLTGLDLKHQIEVLQILKEFSQQGITVIASIHDLNLALNYASEVLLLNAGRVVGQGDASQVLTVETIKQVYDVDTELLAVNGRQFIVSSALPASV